MNKGLFITFEGGEGSGKSTQIRLLDDALKKMGHEVLLTREPGGSSGAEEIRDLLLKGGSDRWDKKAEMLLFSAARRDHLKKKIWPALSENKIVLCDRYADSTIAYQCFGYGFDKKIYEEAQMLYRFIAGDFKPDLTFILDIDPLIGLARSQKRPGNNEQRFEDMDISFHTNIKKAFLEMANNEQERFTVIDANRPIEQIHNDIMNYLREKNYDLVA